MNFTKRQYTEIRKRQERIANLLFEKSDTREVGIDYERGTIHTPNYVIGYFTDYRNMKQLQDNIIKILKNVHEVLDMNDTIRKVNQIQRKW